jgi:hypothetical protein
MSSIAEFSDCDPFCITEAAKYTKKSSETQFYDSMAAINIRSVYDDTVQPAATCMITVRAIENENNND